MMSEPETDFVYGLAASTAFVHDGICFAARASGLAHSVDGGVTWERVVFGRNREAGAPLTVLAVAVSPAFARDRTVFAGVAGGVLRSVDGGETWAGIPLPAPPPTVTCLAISPDFEQDGFLFVGTMEDGVFRSPDRGRSWHSWNFGLLDLRCLALAVSPNFAADETLFVATETAIYRSTNGGRAWRELALPADDAPALSLALSPAFRHDGILFAGTDAGVLLRSRDRGRTWAEVGAGTFDGPLNAVLLALDTPERPAVLVLCEDRLWLSQDDGAFWGVLPAEGITAVAAPEGLGTGAHLLIGLLDGGLARILI